MVWIPARLCFLCRFDAILDKLTQIWPTLRRATVTKLGTFFDFYGKLTGATVSSWYERIPFQSSLLTSNMPSTEVCLLTCLVPRSDHITPVLQDLHWLPVKSRIEFKIALIVYKALNGMAPDYILQLLVTKPTSRYQLRSDDRHLLCIPKTKCKTLGDRAFAHAAPTLWNSLPLSIRESCGVPSFKSNLKTYLFKKAFKC